MKSDTIPLVGENNGPADSPTLTVTGTYNGPPDCGLTQTSPWLVGVNRAPFSDQTYKVMITPQGFDTWPQEFRWRVSCESLIPREYSHDGTEQKDRKKKLLEVILRPFRISLSDKHQRRPIHTIRGHFPLTEIRGAKFPGRQTAATSLCALLQATTLCPSSWSAEVIDRLLLQGDNLHSTRVRHLTGRNAGTENGILKPEQLPANFNSGRTDFTIRFKKVPSHLSSLDTVKMVSNQQSLEKQLRRWLMDSHAGVLMTANDVTFVMSSASGHCYLFHPCMCVQKRFLVSTEESLLMKFRDLEHLCGYVCREIVPEPVSYELMAVEIVTYLDKWAHFTLSRKDF